MPPGGPIFLPSSRREVAHFLAPSHTQFLERASSPASASFQGSPHSPPPQPYACSSLPCRGLLLMAWGQEVEVMRAHVRACAVCVGLSRT